MSIDIRYVTNGNKTIYRVSDGVLDTIDIYKNRNDIPKRIRHYAPEGKPKFVGPNMAAILDVKEILYPDFPNCNHPEYRGDACIAESCKFAKNRDWTKCKYFNKQYKITKEE